MGWNNDDEGPWGRRPTGRPGNQKPGSGNVTDIDELLRKGQENLKSFMGGGKGSAPQGSGRLALYGLLAVLLIWAGTGFYRVQEGEKAAILRFGRLDRIMGPGLRYHLPAPIEEAFVVRVDEINVLESEAPQAGGLVSKRTYALRGENVQNLMLTGDENIIKLRFTVQWFIKDLPAFLFNDPRPRDTIQVAAESAVREVIAQTTLSDALTVGKDKIIRDSKTLLQKLLDDYHLGIEVVKVNLEEVSPPDSVIDAFRDVQRARADRERKINEAKSYRNSIIPVARGESQKIQKAAEADKEAVVNLAKGETARFLSILKEYKLAPDVTLTRLKIENSQRVLKGVQKFVVSGTGGTQNILPYLPLESLKGKSKGSVKSADAAEKTAEASVNTASASSDANKNGA